MSFDEWIKSVPSMNTIERHVASIAYEAGQRDMRGQIIAMCDQEGYGWPADAIRAIKVGGE